MEASCAEARRSASDQTVDISTTEEFVALWRLLFVGTTHSSSDSALSSGGSISQPDTSPQSCLSLRLLRLLCEAIDPKAYVDTSRCTPDMPWLRNELY